jgi:DNA replication factor GINS
MSNPAQDAMSYDDLSVAYRIEKKASTLAPIRKDFYPAVSTLLMSLKTEYDKQLSSDPDSLVCEGANQRRKKANRLSMEVVETRMRKICEMALRGAMGAQNLVDMLTPEEKKYYNDILDISRKQENILKHLSGNRRYETPDISPSAEEPPKAASVSAKAEDLRNIPAEDSDDMPMPDEDGEQLPDDDSTVQTATEQAETVPEAIGITSKIPDIPATDAILADTIDGIYDDTMIIRVLEDLPPFSGPDRDYSLSKEDIVRMPKMMAQVLIDREKAAPVSPAP